MPNTVILSAYAAIHVRSSKLMDAFAHTMQSSSRLPVRICIVLQALLVMLVARFGLNVVMGAFVAGMVVGRASKGRRVGQRGHDFRVGVSVPCRKGRRKLQINP